MEEANIGRLVRSVKGRDKGKFYLIFDMIDEAFVRIIDGEKKTLKNPKKKNVKHLELLPERWEALAERIGLGETLRDREVAEAIQALGLSHME